VVVIAGRTPERSEQLAKSLECKTVDWNARYSVHPDVIVNCTPVGMHPNVDATPYDKHHLRPSMIVFDTVYNPENTLLLKEARSQSCTVVSGVEMFVRQAGLQFQQFTGQEAPADLMRDVLKRAIGPAKY
jgi:3-dehydroquinate dehydratase/shikimate dehydrogenase